LKQSDAQLTLHSAFGAAGTSVAAVLGTLCCAGPAVVGVLGAGGALVAANLEPYRPYLLGAAAAMLANGFWRAYRPRPTATDGAACSIRTGRAVRVVLWLSALVTFASTIAPWLWPS